MLKTRFEEVKALVNRELEKATVRDKICMTTDGWSTQHREALVNYMAVRKGLPYFYDSEMTEDEAHDAQNIVANLEQMIDEIGADKVCGACTDNTSANK